MFERLAPPAAEAEPPSPKARGEPTVAAHARSASAAVPPAALAAGAAVEAGAPAALIVPDGEAPGPAQMARGAFLAQLRAATAATAAAALGPQWTTDGCPYLDAWFARHEDDDAATLERLVRRYAGATPTTAAGYVAAACARLSEGIARWSAGAPLDEHLEAAGLGGEAGAGAVMAKEAPGAQLAEPGSPARVAGQLGGGAPLDSGAAARLGGALGDGFGDVRVHTDARAARLASELGASAFTVGTHVAFAGGAYRPGTVVGDALLAHELAHVAQQRAPGGDRAGLRASVDRPAYEDDADLAAERALARIYDPGSLGRAPAAPRLRAGLALQRCSSNPRPSPRGGRKELAKGTMVWKLESVEGFGGVARIQISFTPRQSVGANTLTFLQTVLETGSPLKMDVVWRKGETVPFYGAEWDPTAKRWGPGPQAEGYRNEPSTGSGTAHMFDAPMVFSRGHEKLFEAVPVVAETGETLGALRWGVADGGTKLFGARDADCTEAPSAEFGAAVEKYYAAPAEVGPDPQRVERFDAILDGFAPDDATLTEKHEAQLDPVAAKVNGDPDLLVELGGFADATEKDPVGVSEKRVQAVEDYLVGKGVARARFSLAQASTRAYGASWARYSPSGTESRNRRVQVFVFHPTEQQRQRASGGAAPAAGARSGSGR